MNGIQSSYQSYFPIKIGLQLLSGSALSLISNFTLFLMSFFLFKIFIFREV